MDLKSHKVYYSRDVVFHGTVFPFAHLIFSAPLFPYTDSDNVYEAAPYDASNVESDGDTAQEHDHLEQETPSQQLGPSSHPIRRSSRQHKILSYLQDYIHYAYAEPFCSTTLTYYSLEPLRMPSYCLSSTSLQFLETLNYTEPQTYAEAAAHPAWQEAMNKELQALRDTNT